ncbi:MAG: isoprenylcysteine carboxylmethyltransferase family protein [Negativicutes bacterium]|nr:isoprenylcysteine carboxylmethyltransferase family protein [Negativicutes bacterium]
MVIGITALAALIALQRLLELALASRNRQWMLARGAQESGGEHYPLFFILQSGWLVGWVAEVVWRGSSLSTFWYFWFTVFIAAQGLRYWCIISLGRYWNTRILVIPGEKKVCRGPYRFLRHPNYLAVAMELVCVPLIYSAWLTAIAATLLNTWLLLRVRIPTEEEALRQLAKLPERTSRLYSGRAPES